MQILQLTIFEISSAIPSPSRTECPKPRIPLCEHAVSAEVNLSSSYSAMLLFYIIRNEYIRSRDLRVVIYTHGGKKEKTSLYRAIFLKLAMALN